MSDGAEQKGGETRSGAERERRGEGGGESGNGSRKPTTSVWEWAVAAVGALLVLSAVAFLLHEGLTEPDTPPLIEVTVETIIESRYGYVVEFRARNHGQQTAAALVVEGELKADTGSVEKAQVTIDYVPAESARRGGLLFSEDPRRYTLDVKAKGYDRP